MGLVTIGEGQGDNNAVGVKCNTRAESWKRKCNFEDDRGGD